MIVIFDIDGTLADCEHRRHFVTGEEKDWDSFFSNCIEDEPVRPIVAVFDALQALGHTVIVVTGRDEERSGELTREWLRLNNIDPEAIFFRKAGDFRPDYEVKEEVLAQIRKEYGDPQLVFEDRKCVVDMWRRNGIICCQVAEGDF
jgi:phosphoglycolate phosphatase-like HAD superfamily hydrolase